MTTGSASTADTEPARAVPGNLTCLEGQTAVVTGASSGFGVNFVRVLTDAGAQVVAVARRLDRLQALAREAPGVIPLACDLSDAEGCTRLVEQIHDVAGPVDILVNNAGVSNVARAEEESPEVFNRIVEVNLLALFRLTHLLVPDMLDKGSGCVVNVASIVGLVGVGRMPQAAYAASKGGVVSLTRELAAQWARRGVRVNALAPGFFPTEMTEKLFDNDAGQDWVRKLTPLGRGGRLDELSGALLYLVDPRNTYTTGVVLPVDGGWTAV